MRDHDPRDARFDSDDTGMGSDAPYESVRDLEPAEEARWSRPSVARLSLGSLDIHDRPTFVP